MQLIAWNIDKGGVVCSAAVNIMEGGVNRVVAVGNLTASAIMCQLS